MSKERKCTNCLHANVCLDRKNVINALRNSSNMRQGYLNSISGIASNCRQYLGIEGRSPDALYIKAKCATSSINWCIDMCKDGEEISKKTIICSTDEWFSSFVCELASASDRLNDTILSIEEPKNDKS